jgi:hypothetical protein
MATKARRAPTDSGTSGDGNSQNVTTAEGDVPRLLRRRSPKNPKDPKDPKSRTRPTSVGSLDRIFDTRRESEDPYSRQESSAFYEHDVLDPYGVVDCEMVSLMPSFIRPRSSTWMT